MSTKVGSPIGLANPNLCWHEAGTDWRHVCPGRDGAYVVWGRCRAGRRWFWAVLALGTNEDDRDADGWADTEDQANADARAAVVELAAERPTVAHVRHGHARHRLKEINAERRRARPSKGSTDPGAVEYLYGIYHGGEGSEAAVVRFQITKKTPKRIYYVRHRYSADDDPAIGFVSRESIETTGEAYNHGAGGWWAADFHLYAEPPEIGSPPVASADVEAELKQLRREMGDAHPDRGGTSAGFMDARRRYKQAVARAASGKHTKEIA